MALRRHETDTPPEVTQCRFFLCVVITTCTSGLGERVCSALRRGDGLGEHVCWALRVGEGGRVRHASK